MSPGSHTPSPVTVLVADDSDADRAAACSALGSAGYRVVEARDGQQALDLCGRENPDLVMLDVVMPRLGGLETCRILKAKARARYLPVIMVSTRNSVNSRVEGLRSGADDYLGKPYDAEELRARVEALLRPRMWSAQSSGKIPASADEDPETLPVAVRMQDEFSRAERYDDPLACLKVALDVPAGVDHPADTATLRAALRRIVDRTIRKIDLCTPQGDAVLLMLPNTHFPGALSVAERIGRGIRRHSWPGRSAEVATASIGVSFYPNKQTRSLEDLLSTVDAALARAQSEAGGRICLYQHQGYLYTPED